MTAIDAQPIDFGRFKFLTEKRAAIRVLIADRKTREAEDALTKLACISFLDEAAVARVRSRIVTNLEHELMLKRQQMLAERYAAQDKGRA